MSFAATSMRGARLKARFAVKGIHRASSDGRPVAAVGMGTDAEMVCGMGAPDVACARIRDLLSEPSWGEYDLRATRGRAARPRSRLLELQARPRLLARGEQ